MHDVPEPLLLTAGVEAAMLASSDYTGSWRPCVPLLQPVHTLDLPCTCCCALPHADGKRCRCGHRGGDGGDGGGVAGGSVDEGG